jgi:uncharacterized protein YecE (DUF72 family)
VELLALVKGVFYPRAMPVSGWLAFYATHFPTVEINSTFYRLPSPEILRRWRNATPDHFRFTAKASRFITHMKKLATPEIHAARFLDGISELGEKLATVLYQLPTFWEFDRRRWIQRESRLHTRHPLLLQQRPAGRGDSRCHAADPKNPNKKVATPISGTLDSPLLFQEP